MTSCRISKGHGARTSPPVNFTIAELQLVGEALAVAASRHESQADVTQGRFRNLHTYKARMMRELRRRLMGAQP